MPEPDFRASEVYRELVGAPREITSNHVMNTLGLEDDLGPLMAKYGVSKPVDALTAVRYEIYYEMVSDLQVIRDNQWPYTVDLLRMAKAKSWKTILATLSKRKDVTHVITALGIKDLLDVIATAEDVTRGKPDPEIYLLIAQKLGLPPTECLVLEDSVNGVKSALAAGMSVVAIATPFTKTSLLLSQVIDDKWIVKNPEKVADVVQSRIDDHNRTAQQDTTVRTNK